jgi:hypothetical protein
MCRILLCHYSNIINYKFLKMKKLLILMVAISALYSCTEDPAADVAPQTQNPQIILAPMATSDVTEVVAQVGPNTINVDFGFGFVGGTTYYDRDVDITYQGDTYTIFADPAGDNYVPVGNIDYTYNVPAPAGAVPFGGITTNVEVDLSATEYTYEMESRPSDLVVLKGSSTPLTVGATLYRSLPQVSGDDLVIQLDWDDEPSDIDLHIYNAGGTSVDYSWFSYPEECVLSASEPDGTYTAVARCWTNNSPSGNINYQMFTREPDDTLGIYDGTMINPSPYWGTNIVVLEIVKTGNTYAITQL